MGSASPPHSLSVWFGEGLSAKALHGTGAEMNLTSHTHIWQTSAAWDPAELWEAGQADQELP